MSQDPRNFTLLSDLKTGDLTLFSANGRETLVIFKSDGKVEIRTPIGEVYRAFWEAVAASNPLRARVLTLESRIRIVLDYLIRQDIAEAKRLLEEVLNVRDLRSDRGS